MYILLLTRPTFSRGSKLESQFTLKEDTMKSFVNPTITQVQAFAKASCEIRRSFACILAVAVCSISPLMAATQSIALKQGWNLISFNLTPDSPSPASVFQGIGANFVEAVVIDNATKKRTFFKHTNQTDAATANALDPMPNITLGQGYFVH
jgi:hypothetical protein